MGGLALRAGWTVGLCVLLGAPPAQAQMRGRLVVGEESGGITFHCDPECSVGSPCPPGTPCIMPGGAAFSICSAEPGFEILCCSRAEDCGFRMRPDGRRSMGLCLPLVDGGSTTSTRICIYPCQFDLCIDPASMPTADDLDQCTGDPDGSSGERRYLNGDCDEDGMPNGDGMGTLDDCDMRSTSCGMDAGVTPFLDGGMPGSDADTGDEDAGSGDDDGGPRRDGGSDRPDAERNMDAGGGGGTGPGPGFRGRGAGCAAGGDTPGSLALFAVAVLALVRRRRKLRP